MFYNATIQIFCESRIVCAIRALENVDRVRHRRNFGYARFVFTRLSARSAQRDSLPVTLPSPLQTSRDPPIANRESLYIIHLGQVILHVYHALQCDLYPLRESCPRGGRWINDARSQMWFVLPSVYPARFE